MKLGNLDGKPVIIDGGLAYAIDPSDIDGGDPFIEAIRRWAKLTTAEPRGPGQAFDPSSLGPPVPKPGKILGAPVNYLDHKKEMNVEHTISGLGFFLKSPSSVIGPGETVVLPFPDRRTDQEAELGVVIGSKAEHVTIDDALNHVFGYTCLVDVTVRGAEERSTRKSFPGFTPIGPWVTTTEEIPDPTDLRIQGWVNEELRQDESTSQMVYGVAQLIEFMSSVVALEPGDIIATGTPAGVGPVNNGDRITVEIGHVGRLEVGVASGNRDPHPLWLTRQVQ